MKGPLAKLVEAERRRQRGPLLVASLCAVACAAAAVALLALSGQFITAAALAGAAGTALTFNFLLPAAAIRGLAILRTVGRYGERLESHRAALGALARIRATLFAALTAAPAAQALALATGDASARLVQDVGAIETLLVRRSSRWGAGAALIAGLGLTSLAGWPCAIATAGAFGLAAGSAWLTSRLFARPSGAAWQRAAGRLKDDAFALLSAAPELVAYELQDWASARIAEDGAALDAAGRRIAMIESGQTALFAMSSAMAAVWVLLLAQAAPRPIAALAALSALATLEGGLGLVRGLLRDGGAAEAARRLDPILTQPTPAGVDVRVGTAPIAARSAPVRSAPVHPAPVHPAPVRPPPLRPTCVALTLRRPGGTRVALAPGEHLAVTGRSGAGKTTLLDKLVKLRDCEPGELTLGGADVADLAPQAARAAFAYGAQSALLLSGTIADNLRLGAPDADTAALWAALFDAGLDSRIASMPLGLETQIGEGGERLSGGEGRRLALARALLKPAPWLLLDEPTEGLDRDTETLVVERLKLRLHRTRQGLILVSHRPAALGLCTRTLQMDCAAAWPAAA